MKSQAECSPELVCRCCECQGIKCLVYHPGHNHRIKGLEVMDELFGEDIRKCQIKTIKGASEQNDC